ncbi:MAG: EutN/CcmL family microcompartment protein [Lachnospiraceae bacterium]|nr:EutN/CcmL family microcompartment protein [Lachnospiraceae bacterium]
MIVGKVIGSLISTRKSQNLVGNKFMIVEPLPIMKMNSGCLVAIDNIGAGIGETVLVATGSSARIGSGSGDSPVDAAIVGIVDEENEFLTRLK